MFSPSLNPPTESEIARAFGFPPPEGFVRLLHWIHSETGEIASRDGSLFEQVTGLYPGGQDLRYHQTPTELFPFGRPGVDGIHFGYLIHDVKLGPDFAVGYFCPMDLDGVQHVGVDTLDGLGTLLSRRLCDSIEKPVADQIRALAKILGVKASKSRNRQKAGWGFGLPSDNLPVVKNRVPKNWKEVKTQDGLGVLAATSAFTSKSMKGSWRERATRLLDDGYPGSALVVVRDAAWNDALNPGEVSDLLQRAYTDLERPLHARVAKEQGRTYP